MLELIFEVGPTISVALLIYGAYVSLDYAFFSGNSAPAEDKRRELRPLATV